MDEAKLAKLEKPSADPAEVADLILEADGRLPHLRIDITDPPSPVIATVGELAAQATNADDAIRELGKAKAARVRADIAVVEEP